MAKNELQPEGGWAQPATPRLPPPAPADRALAFRALSWTARLFGRQQVPDIFSVFQINGRLFWPWLLFASRLMPGGRLPARDREKIILRTAWNCRSRYEWGQHVEIGLRVGVDDAAIQRLARGPAACSDPQERALLQACDEVFREKCIDDATWAQLGGRYDRRLLIEIVILIGHYEMVAGFLNSAGIVLEPAIEEVLQAFHRRIGLG